VLDVLKPLNDLAILTNELEGVGIRLNKKPPNITIKQRERGGVRIYDDCETVVQVMLTHGDVLPLAVCNPHRAFDPDRPGGNSSRLLGIPIDQCYHLDPRARLHHRSSVGCAGREPSLHPRRLCLEQDRRYLH